MRTWVRAGSVLLFLLALAGIGALWVADGLHAFQPTRWHQQLGAVALILIGASYIFLQLAEPRRRGEALKGVFLGAAFVLWGGEQFLPPGPGVTAIDGVVITIFVVDLGAMIFGRIRPRRRD
jgi:hypothetical protein